MEIYLLSYNTEKEDTYNKLTEKKKKLLKLPTSYLRIVGGGHTEIIVHISYPFYLTYS